MPGKPMNFRAIVLSLGLMLTSMGLASASPTAPAQFQATVSPAPVHPGEIAMVHIAATIDPGWHLYSLVPTPPPGPSPTQITVSGPNVTPVGNAAEDVPTQANDPNFGKQVAYHETTAQFTIPVRVTKAATENPVAQITIHYQTCNDKICLPPTVTTLTATLHIAPGAVRSEYANPPVAPSVAASAAPAASGIGAMPDAKPMPLLPFLGGAFLAGLLALLTPCVFPLIPVTFGFFTKQVGDDHRKLIALASTYALGIIVAFTLLGLVMAVVLGAAGANRVAANPWFNLGFGILFVVFAFSFFETINLQLPPSLSRLAAPVQRGGGIVTALLMGLAFVFAAFTCTAPFIGTVLVAAASATQTGAWLRPLLGMTTFALALALPFFLLAFFPQLLSKLPKSGGWLSRTKAILGFVELAYALLYFSKADLVWQSGILTRPALLALWTAIALAGMLYLIGALRLNPYQDEMGKLTWGRGLGIAAFAGVALYCLYGLTGRPVAGALAAFLPPSDYGPRGSIQTAQAGNALTWNDSFAGAVAEAKAQGKPVFIDFTGYTCTNCRWMELNVFSKPDVRQLLETKFARAQLYTDGGPHGLENQKFQAAKFGTVALPLYAIVTPDGQILGQSPGITSDPMQFAQFLTKGLHMAQATSGSAPGAGSQSWAALSDAGLQSASASGKPAIIDFTAAWCTNCHAIEKSVFPAPSVASQLGSFATFRADMTNYYSPANLALEKKYKIVALPAIVFLDGQGHEVPGTRVTGLLSASDFAARMVKAGAKPSVVASAR